MNSCDPMQGYDSPVAGDFTIMMSAHHPFVKKTAFSLRRRCHILPNSKLIVAVSGGADSSALLRAIAAVAPRRKWRLQLAVGHVQHHLRPEEQSEGDARFVADLATKLGLPFFRADLDPHLLRQNGNLEARARRARYHALFEMAAQFNAAAIVTAHQGDDQLETLLMRLLRGSSVKGLGGMPWSRPLAGGSEIKLLRPMLAVDRRAVLRFLTDLSQPWREDHTNTDPTRLRAFLRHEILPKLRQIRPAVSTKAVALADQLRGVSDLIDYLVEQAAEKVTRGEGFISIDRGYAKSLHRVVLAELIHKLLVRAGLAADTLSDHTLGIIVRAVRDSQGGSRSFSLHGGVGVELTRDRVIFKKHNDSSDQHPAP